MGSLKMMCRLYIQKTVFAASIIELLNIFMQSLLQVIKIITIVSIYYKV